MCSPMLSGDEAMKHNDTLHDSWNNCISIHGSCIRAGCCSMIGYAAEGTGLWGAAINACFCPRKHLMLPDNEIMLHVLHLFCILHTLSDEPFAFFGRSYSEELWFGAWH